MANGANEHTQAHTFINEPRHGKMCLRGKFGHFEIL